MMNKYQQKVLQFDIVKKLGQGAFGQVLLGKNNDGKQVAIKKISKQQIIKINKLHQPFIQKQILLKLNQTKQNFYIKIQATHSDQSYIYLILQLCQGGTLEQFVKNNQKLNIQLLRKIIVRLVLMLENFHKLKLIHRDLKPSNLLLTKDGYIKLSDFGTCYAPEDFFSVQVAKQIQSIKNIAQNKKDQKCRKLQQQQSQLSTSTSQRRYTFVGTACYMAPELLNQDKCGLESDLWALGCICYQMLHKQSPFYDQSQGKIWSKILNSDIKVFEIGKQINQLQKKLEDFIQQLLIKENQKRLGYGQHGYKYLKSHPFFQGVQWEIQGKNYIQEIKQWVKINIQSAKQIQLKKITQQDKVLFSSVVNKKMYFGNYKQRTLVLHSLPKLVYYETDSGQKKGQILITKNSPIKLDGKYFQVTSEKKTYYFKSKQASEWVQMIKLGILNAFY